MKKDKITDHATMSLFREIQKIVGTRDIYRKVLTQIADQPRGSLSRRLARAGLDFVDNMDVKQG